MCFPIDHNCRYIYIYMICLQYIYIYSFLFCIYIYKHLCGRLSNFCRTFPSEFGRHSVHCSGLSCTKNINIRIIADRRFISIYIYTCQLVYSDIYIYMLSLCICIYIYVLKNIYTLYNRI